MAIEDREAMAGSYKTQIGKFGTPISTDEYRELREYAESRGIRIQGFKVFVGNVWTIKTVIDDICEIAADFPLILDRRNGVVLDFDYHMDADDFATTDSGHVIHLNAAHFSNLDRLKESYRKEVKNGDFVAGTDWRAIGRHETGHVVESFYRFDIIGITAGILGMRVGNAMFLRLEKELSFYAAMYFDGREIIAESFSGYYSKVGNVFADAFVGKCLSLRKDKDLSEGNGGDTMRAHDEALYWMRNDSWVKLDDQKDCLELSQDAPPRAVASFRLYLERNNLPVTEPMMIVGDQIAHRAVVV